MQLLSAKIEETAPKIITKPYRRIIGKHRKKFRAKLPLFRSLFHLLVITNLERKNKQFESNGIPEQGTSYRSN